MRSQETESNSAHKWYMPDHFVTQFAGDIGFFSIGAGYDFNIEKVSTDIMLGYVPEFIRGIDILSVSLKVIYKPFGKNIIADNLFIHPIQLTLSSTYSFGEQYQKLSGVDYPKGYYWWTTRYRYGISIGESLKLISKSGSKINAYELYYDFGTNDLLLYSYFDNNEIRLYEITHFSCGIKMFF